MKYAWIRQYRDSFPVAVACQVLEVSTSGYYASLDRQPSPRKNNVQPAFGRRSRKCIPNRTAFTAA